MLRTRSPGMTLLEMMVVLVILGVLTAAVAAVPLIAFETSVRSDAQALIRARAEAARTGLPVRVIIESDTVPHDVWALPAGSFIGTGMSHLDAFTGQHVVGLPTSRARQ